MEKFALNFNKGKLTVEFGNTQHISIENTCFH